MAAVWDNPWPVIDRRVPGVRAQLQRKRRFVQLRPEGLQLMGQSVDGLHPGAEESRCKNLGGA